MKILAGIDLALYGLLESDIRIQDQTLVVIKRDWDYPLALAFQEILCERIWTHKDERAFIFCSHPHCLTLGRGLQKNKNLSQTLVDFDPSLEGKLEVPLYHIARGGGLTFHYPGQLVFYPIMSLENHKLKIFDLLLGVLKVYKTALEELYQLDGLDCERDLLGLWHGPYKLASIGVSARRFVSYHGLALNLERDPLIARTLANVYPCGLAGTSYTYLADHCNTAEVPQLFERLQHKALELCFKAF